MLVNTIAYCIKANEMRSGAVTCNLLWDLEDWSSLPCFALGLWNWRVKCCALSWQLQGAIAEANSCIAPGILDYSIVVVA